MAKAASTARLSRGVKKKHSLRGHSGQSFGASGAAPLQWR
jgi:hypothetical protein